MDGRWLLVDEIATYLGVKRDMIFLKVRLGGGRYFG